jgi:hypothetical protein
MAPVAPSLLVALVMGSIQAASLGTSLIWRGVLSDFTMILIFAETICILIGVPAFFLVRRFAEVGILECVLCGLAIGLILGPLGAVTGALSGFSFWALALRTTAAKS